MVKKQKFFGSIKGRKGWIRIVEAFIAVMMIIIILLIVINKGYIGRKDISAEVYDIEVLVLREIELNNELRKAILTMSGLPIQWGDFPISVKNVITSRVPSYLECKGKICWMDEICALETYINKEIYAQAVGITATLETYSPRQLKLFCWKK